MKTEFYLDQQTRLPNTGKHIIADFTRENLFVYQAFKPSIATYATTHQAFGGPDYNSTRMTWIKPGFMWMMYRSGWATKKDQERILRLTISRAGWEQLLKSAILSSFDATIHESYETWQLDIKNSDVRLQWDPDHDPSGTKLVRKAIQIGLRGAELSRFHNDYLQKIEDITHFVEEQRGRPIGDLLVPVEEVL